MNFFIVICSKTSVFWGCRLLGNVRMLEEHYPHIVKSSNAELRLRWAQIVAKNQHKPGYQHIRSFLSWQVKQNFIFDLVFFPAFFMTDRKSLLKLSFPFSQGKQKYTLPVYRALWSGSEETKALATEIFSATSHQLHVNVRNYVKKILV